MLFENDESSRVGILEVQLTDVTKKCSELQVSSCSPHTSHAFIVTLPVNDWKRFEKKRFVRARLVVFVHKNLFLSVLCRVFCLES